MNLSAGSFESIAKAASIIVGTVSVAFSIVWTALEATATLRSVRAQTDLQLTESYLNVLVPVLTAVQEPYVSEKCVEKQIDEPSDEEVDLVDIIHTCTGFVPRERSGQVGGYWASVVLAQRHPILCRMVTETMKHRLVVRPDRTDLKEALAQIDECD